MHGIIVLNDVGSSVGAPLAGDHQHDPDADDIRVSLADTPLQEDGATARVARATKSVGDIIGTYKSLVANECLEIFKIKWAAKNPVPMMGKLCHRNFYEHIIRNEKSYQTISNYIINNRANWNEDKFYQDKI